MTIPSFSVTFDDFPQITVLDLIGSSGGYTALSWTDVGIFIAIERVMSNSGSDYIYNKT